MNSRHPCFNKNACHEYGRIHLPVAPLCNIRCGYCDRRHSCVNESRPGVTAKVIKPREALQVLLQEVERMPWISVAGIAGPGDPLANPDETLETLRLVREAMPGLVPCLSTNGLALPDYAADLAALGITHITVTVNAVDPVVGAKLYCHVTTARGKLTGIEGAQTLLERQLQGIRLVKKHGMTVKVNMVLVTGINDGHVEDVARFMAAENVDLMNIIPMLPVAGAPLGHIPEPGKDALAKARSRAQKWIPQMRHCGRCRADAVGLIGGEKPGIMS